MNKVLTFVFLLFIFLPLSSTNTKIEALKDRLDETVVSEQAKFLNDISVEFRQIDVTKSLEYAQKALTNAKLYENIEQIGNAYHNCGVAYHYMRNYDKALQNYDYAINRRNEIADAKGLSDSYFNKGLIERNLGNHQQALTYFTESLRLREQLEDKELLAKTMEKISDVYKNLSDYEKALKFDLDAIKLYEELGYEKGIADARMNIGYIYFQLDSYDTALEYFKQSLKINRKLDNKKGIASSYNGLGTIYAVIKEYDEALNSFQRSLKIRREINDRKGTADVLSNLGSISWETEKFKDALTYYKQALAIYEEINDKYRIAKIDFNLGHVYLRNNKLDSAYSYLQKALDLARDIEAKDVQADAYEALSDYYRLNNDYKNSFINYKKYATLKDSILNETKSEQIAEMQTRYETEKKEKEIQILKKDQTIQELQLKRQGMQRNSLIIGLLFLVILALVIFNRYKFEKKAHAKLEEANQIIQKEKETSDKLLLNILPERVAKDLKETGKTTPESYDDVTILFSDFVNFTKKSSDLPPDTLISELNDIFTSFDDIIENHDCERIKTIGDAYLAVCGLPDPDKKHAENIVDSAIEIIRYLQRRNQRSPIKWQIRIGIHSGSVVGGIVGVKKYIFDIFGDALNTASRMESNSDSMKINISETTYNLLPDKYHFTKRKPLQVKGKGTMNMYFLEVQND